MSITLYHWTHKRKLPSINRLGLRLEYAETADGLLYAVGYARILAGLIHVAKRHGWKPTDMVCVKATVPLTGKWVSSHAGFYRVLQDIPRDRLTIAMPIWESTTMCGSLPGRISVSSLDVTPRPIRTLRTGRGSANAAWKSYVWAGGRRV